MNKESIKKYKNEFDHWLNGGSVLIRSMDYEDHKYTQFTEIDRDHKWDNFQYEQQYIINDEYSKFRKALAEGRTIEYLGQSSNVWHEVQEPDFNLHPTCYRIKPNEPKFKVGDFVKYIHSTPARALEINNINGNRYYFTNSEMSCLKHELKLWTPVKGEWCWFYDSKSSKYAIVSQFKETWNAEFISITDAYWKFCEPFLNSRPSYLKDK